MNSTGFGGPLRMRSSSVPRTRVNGQYQESVNRLEEVSALSSRLGLGSLKDLINNFHRASA